MKKKKSLLIFALYSDGFIPLTVESYLKELNKYFTDVIVATNYSGYYDLPYKHIFCKNEGYDFGMWYNVLQKIDVREYDKIALVNDSNSLVGTFGKVFEWGATCGLDMWGVSDSVERTLTYRGKNSYHVQSFFMVFEKKSIRKLLPFFQYINFKKRFMKKSTPELKQMIIDNCEIGLSQYLKSFGMKIGAKWSIDQKNKPWSGFKQNIHFWKWEELIKDGYPLIKNKIISCVATPHQFPWPPELLPPNLNNRKKYYRYG